MTTVTRIAGRAGMAAVATLALWTMGACGNLTAGGFGETTVLVTSEGDGAEPDPSGQAFSLMHGDDAPSATASTPDLLPDALEGTLQVSLRVYVRDTSNFWTELTGGARTLTLPLSGGVEEELITRRIGTGLYPQIRIVFSAIEADITGGLIIGGLPLLGTVQVPTATSVTVERSLDLFVDDRDPVSLVIELNAAHWLQTADALAREVTPAAFEAGVRVRRGGS